MRSKLSKLQIILTLTKFCYGINWILPLGIVFLSLSSGLTAYLKERTTNRSFN